MPLMCWVCWLKLSVVKRWAISSHEHIFKPLKMFETSFNVPADKHHRIAEPFKKDPDGGIQLKLINIQDQPQL